MAGWGRGDDGPDVDPVELVDDGDRSDADIATRRDVDWHGVIRTAAAAVGALSLLWMGRSWADERAAARRSECQNEVQNVLWRWEEATSQRQFGSGRPEVPREVLEQIVADARDCGDELFADAVEYRLAPDEEDDG